MGHSFIGHSLIGIGRRIRDARKRTQCSQSELATAVGVSVGSISRIERGEFEPSLRTAAAISRELGIGMEEMVSGEPTAEPSALTRRVHRELGKLEPFELEVIGDLARVFSSRRGRQKED